MRNKTDDLFFILSMLLVGFVIGYITANIQMVYQEKNRVFIYEK